MANRQGGGPTERQKELSDQPRAARTASLVHGAVAAVGALMVLALLFFLGWEALTTRQAPPHVSVRVERIEPQDAGWLVLFAAENRADSTASALKIVGRLAQEGSTAEESRVTLDYLPARSIRRGGLLFSRDPRAAELELRAEGYLEP